MIKISIEKKQDKIDTLTIKGHSGYEDLGKDIVCAAVSSISITTVNALISIDEDCIDYTNDDGFLKIIIKKHDEIIDKLINNMINLLKELEKDYKENIEIR